MRSRRECPALLCRIAAYRDPCVRSTSPKRKRETSDIEYSIDIANRKSVFFNTFVCSNKSGTVVSGKGEIFYHISDCLRSETGT